MRPSKILARHWLFAKCRAIREQSIFLNSLLGGPKIEGPELVQETFRSTNPPGDFQTAWSRFLHDGFAAHVQPRDQSPSFNGGAAAALMGNSWTLPSVPTPDSPEIMLT